MAGARKSERKVNPLGQPGYRNGYGKPRRFTMSLEKWLGEYEQWKSTAIEERDWAYLWADGIYVKAGLGKEKATLLVVIGYSATVANGFWHWSQGIARASNPGLKF
jgi:hypothetical protein